MHHTEKMIEVRDALKALGHDCFISKFADEFIGKNDSEKEKIKIDQKNNQDAIREFWDLMQDSDAILVLNLERKNIPNYIGGNAFLEMGFAHVLDQRIFLYNPIPEIDFYKSEIEAMKPIIIHGDLTLIQ